MNQLNQLTNINLNQSQLLHLQVTDPQDLCSAEGRAVHLAIRTTGRCYEAATASEAQVRTWSGVAPPGDAGIIQHGGW